MENLTLSFSHRLKTLGDEARDSIENFMKDKAEYWANGYNHNIEITDEELEELFTNPDRPDWIEFYNDNADKVILLGLNRDDKGCIIIWGITDIWHCPKELTEYSLDQLDSYVICSLADDLKQIP